MAIGSSGQDRRMCSVLSHQMHRGGGREPVALVAVKVDFGVCILASRMRQSRENCSVNLVIESTVETGAVAGAGTTVGETTVGSRGEVGRVGGLIEVVELLAPPKPPSIARSLL